MKIGIIGAGNVGHALAGILSRSTDVVLITDKKIAQYLTIIEGDQTFLSGRIQSTSKFSQVKDCSIILLAVPANAIEQSLKNIKPFVSKGQSIGCVTGSGGFHWIASKIINLPVFSFQRVPFICRVTKPGESVTIKSRRNEMIQYGCPDVARTFSFLLNIPFNQTPSIFDVAITNSNPILHTCRLISLTKSKHTNSVGFYSDWDNDSSRLLLSCDKEVCKVAKACGTKITPIQEYYDVTSDIELTEKIKNIKAFVGIQVPLDDGSVRVNHRLFDEDVFCGLSSLRGLASLAGVATPNLDTVFTELVAYARSMGSWTQEIGEPRLWGITSIEMASKL